MLSIKKKIFWKYSKCKNTSKVKDQSKNRLFKCAYYLYFFNRILIMDIIDYWFILSILWWKLVFYENLWQVL